MLDSVVVWLGRDLRLHDNPALSAALLTARKVVIAYVWSPEEEGQFQPGRASRWWLYHSLSALEKQIEERGSFVCYRRGPCAADQLLEICREASASVVYFNNVYDPLSLIRDHGVKRQLTSAGIVVRNFNADLLFEPWHILSDDGSPFTTFNGFWDRMTNMPEGPAAPSFVEPSIIPTVNNPCLRQVKLDDLGLISASERWAHAHFSDKWTPGTEAGLMLLVDFLDNRLPDFEADRAKIDRDSTSRLSPYIHFGEVSVRVIYHEVKQREAALRKNNSTGVDAFLKQLGFREYSRYLSFHFPFTHERSLLEHVRAVPWTHCPVRFKAWRQGMTGYPIVDAAMRQLWVTGWMHNRARVFTASFMVKNLLLPWQWGLKHFWDMLLDADLECDALGWQYVAGCLRDAHPFTYLMDFETESKRFDPDGAFVRKWVPELAQVPLRHIHQPWEAPEAVLAQAGVVLGVEYPTPITSVAESRAAVDHAYGVVQKCMYVRNLNPEPYQLPTIPIKMKLLEPEDEVDQKPQGAGFQYTSQDGENSELAIRALGNNTQQQLLAPSLEGVVLREEQIPPSCVIPELPDVCNLNERTSSQAASHMASCGHSQGQDNGMHASHARPCESHCASVNEASCSQAHVHLSPPPPFAVSGTTHRTNTQIPQSAVSHAQLNCAQWSIRLGGTDSQCRKPGDEGREHASCVTDELANYSNSASCIEARLPGLPQASPTGSQREQGPFAENACAPASTSSLAEIQVQPPRGDDKSGSDTKCLKRQRDAATDSLSEADFHCTPASSSGLRLQSSRHS